MNWYVKCIKQYVDFNGRARRKEYWMFFLLNCVFAIVANLLDLIVIPDGMDAFNLLYSLFVLLPGLAVGARRLHDIGKSGYWLLIGFVPIVGVILLLVWACKEGEKNTNSYGSDPKTAAL